jgi:hypothetical protein
MTFDRQDLLIELRKLAAAGDERADHEAADLALLKFIDDEQVTEAWEAIPKWFA